MITVILILLGILLIKKVVNLLVYLWKNPISAIVTIGLVIFFTSDAFLDSAFKDSSMLKEYGYSTDAKGIKSMVKNSAEFFYSNRKSIAKAAGEMIEEYADTVGNRVAESFK